MTITTAMNRSKKITTRELAERLGVSQSTAYNYLNEGLIPGARRLAPNKSWYIPADAVAVATDAP